MKSVVLTVLYFQVNVAFYCAPILLALGSFLITFNNNHALLSLGCVYLFSKSYFPSTHSFRLVKIVAVVP